MEQEDIRLQVGWVYVGAGWGQKAEMLKKCWFLKLFLKGQAGPEYARAANNRARKGKNHEKSGLKMKNGAGRP